MNYNYNAYYAHAIYLVRTQTVYKCPKMCQNVPKLMMVVVYLISIATLPRVTMTKVPS